MKLSLSVPALYRMKRGQTLYDVAETFRLPAALLARENGLKQDPAEGEILSIPAQKGNLYTVRGGESKRLLCGSEEAFEKKNGTRALYVGQRVLL